MAGNDQRPEPDHFMMDYHPYRQGQGDQDRDSQTLVYLKMGNVYDENRRDEFIERIQGWLRTCINNHIVAQHPKEKIMFGFVPGHSPDPDNVSFMITQLNISNLCDNQDFAVDPNMLRRTIEVESQAQGGAPRDITRHLETIKVVADVRGKVVCIMDDVWTTGATMNACIQLVTNAGAKKVYTLIIGRTV